MAAIALSSSLAAATTPIPFASFSSSSPRLPKTLTITSHRRRRRGAVTLVPASSSSSPSPSPAAGEDEEWLARLPEKKKPLYTHSLPCMEAWLRRLGFAQSREDRAVWVAEMPLWHARLSLDVTDLCIRYLKSGPGNLEKDVERRFSYALSREDIENAILGGP